MKANESDVLWSKENERDGLWSEETQIKCDHKIDKVIIKELKLGDYVMVKC